MFHLLSSFFFLHRVFIRWYWGYCQIRRLNWKRKLQKTYRREILCDNDIEQRLKTRTQIVQQLKIGESTLTNWWKNRASIKYKFEKISRKQKFSRIGKWDQLDSLLYKRFTQEREVGVLMTTEKLLVDAASYAKVLGLTDISDTELSGWLDQFKRKNGINLKLTCFEPKYKDPSFKRKKVSVLY